MRRTPTNHTPQTPLPLTPCTRLRHYDIASVTAASGGCTKSTHRRHYPEHALLVRCTHVIVHRRAKAAELEAAKATSADDAAGLDLQLAMAAELAAMELEQVCCQA